MSITIPFWLPYITTFLAGAVVGVMGMYIFTSFWDWRTPSTERAYRGMRRMAKKMRLTYDEVREATTPLDLGRDRLLPLLREIHKEELTLEQGSEALDRLRAFLKGDWPEEYVHGWRRSLVGTRSYPEVDKRTRLPGISQPGDNARPEDETPEAAKAASEKEWTADREATTRMTQEAERRVRDSSGDSTI